MLTYCIFRNIRTNISKRYFSVNISQSVTKKEVYFVVINGKNPGIFKTWDECREQIHQFPNAQFKSFKKKLGALNYLESEIETLKMEDCQKISAIHLEKLEEIYRSFTKEWEVSIPEEINPTSKVDSRGREFFIDDEDYLIIYTDGSCLRNGSPGAAAGVGVYFGPNNPLNVSKVVEGKASSNRAEIRAAIEALKKAQDTGFDKIKILTDSHFLIFCVTIWMKKWERNGWKKANGSPLSNLEDIQELHVLIQHFKDVRLVHIPAHQGIKGNEEADRLARLNLVNSTEEDDQQNLPLG